MFRNILDGLYGEVAFEEHVAELIATPIVQRLRHVRLSNIDSLNMPGIANLSRFEHALGVGFLASEMGVIKSLPKTDRLIILAAALLHDWAITAFGHLVEEAYQFADLPFNHEEQLRRLFVGEAQEELGGLSPQILHGREARLVEWAKKAVGPSSLKELLEGVVSCISGKGQYGRIISADIDIDNIDNIYRVAYHAGIPCDKAVPHRLAKGLVDLDKTSGTPVYRKDCRDDIASWVAARSDVYSHLMPARFDFAGKVMMLSAAVAAVEAQELRITDWNKTDYEFINKMLSSDSKDIKQTVERWLTGELWDVSPLYWFQGDRPKFPKLLSFSRELEKKFGHKFFSYGIKDKRNRLINVLFDDGATETFGQPSSQWFFGVGSQFRMQFTQKECEAITGMAEQFFGCACVGKHVSRDQDQLCLL